MDEEHKKHLLSLITRDKPGESLTDPDKAAKPLSHSTDSLSYQLLKQFLDQSVIPPPQLGTEVSSVYHMLFILP